MRAPLWYKCKSQFYNSTNSYGKNHGKETLYKFLDDFNKLYTIFEVIHESRGENIAVLHINVVLSNVTIATNC